MITISKTINILSPPFAFTGELYSDYALFYKRLATDFNNMLYSIDNNLDAIETLLILLDYMVDLTMDVNFDANQAMLDIYFVLKDDVLKGLNILPRDSAQLLKGVKAINEHTKRYIASDLTDYVNNEVWYSDCVPYRWAYLSELAGEDISGWDVCDIS